MIDAGEGDNIYRFCVGGSGDLSGRSASKPV